MSPTAAHVPAWAALRVARGDIPYHEAVQALIWQARFQPGRNADGRTEAEILADDAAFAKFILDHWLDRADEARLRAAGRVSAALAPLLAARAPSDELLATARAAMGRPVLSDTELLRLVEREVWFLLKRERRAERTRRMAMA